MKITSGLAVLIIVLVLIIGGIWFGNKESPEPEQNELTTEALEPEIADQKIEQPEVIQPQTKAIKPQTKAGVLEVSKAEPGCHLVRFKHQHPGIVSADLCRQHKNQITYFEKSGVNLADTSAICVRVDGNAVEFKREASNIVFNGPVNPDSVVSVQYCTGKSKCPSNPCTPSKDRFLVAVGADRESPEHLPSQKKIEAKWDPSDPENDVDVSATIPIELLSEPKEAPSKQNQTVFKDWTVSSIQKSCRETVLSAR